jgi:phosphoribosylaminoimidazole-succinocarboxamide synthase
MLGSALAHKVRATALALYQEAFSHAQRRGILIADTKFEFGLDPSGAMRLMDEVLTPDSSRFWPLDQYRPGASPPSFDKQFVRDWLQAQPWNKAPPAPALPREIVERTAQKYREALRRLTDSMDA